MHLKKNLLGVVSKPSIGFKIKAWQGVQPQEYIEYFEYWALRSTPRIERGAGFYNHF
jgi:hypothetical protein